MVPANAICLLKSTAKIARTIIVLGVEALVFFSAMTAVIITATQPTAPQPVVPVKIACGAEAPATLSATWGVNVNSSIVDSAPTLHTTSVFGPMKHVCHRPIARS